MSVCGCDAYRFPHRHGGGECPGKKFYCPECGVAFDYPKEKTTPATWGYYGGDPEEIQQWCPCCGHEDFEEVQA